MTSHDCEIQKYTHTCYLLQSVLIHIGIEVTAQDISAPSLTDRLRNVSIICQAHHVPNLKLTQFIVQIILCSGYITDNQE